MKKILLSCVLAICFVSCNEQTTVSDFRKDSDMLFSNIFHFKYMGHDYIYFKRGYGEYSNGGVVHDPSCACQTIINKEESK